MTIDSNIVIAYLAGEKKPVNLLTAWRRQGGFLYLPTIVETEILSFPKWEDSEYQMAIRFLEENFISISFDRTLAHLAANIRRKVNIKLPDAAIAATALRTKTPLLTRNIKDFKKVSGLKLLTI